MGILCGTCLETLSRISYRRSGYSAESLWSLESVLKLLKRSCGNWLGGILRALGIIWREGLRVWLEKIIDGIRRFARDLPEERREKTLEEISAGADDVNSMGWLDPSVRNIMLKHNIIIYIAGADKISEMPREPWIGREYAYQLLAYYYILKAMAKKRSIDIESREIIEHL